MKAETEAERRVWRLLTRDFYWQLPTDFAVRVYGEPEDPPQRFRLQIFEVAVAAIFARLRPDYDWYVTPNRPDGGLDFVGQHRFLEDEALGIAAAITVGGQCKKRSSVKDIVAEVAGSLARMAATINPTFFVVALSARLKRDRIEAAREILEQTHQRHCHILDRRQIEGLIHEHLPLVDEILRESLSEDDIGEVLGYFDAFPDGRRTISLTAASPDRVLAGIPFSVSVSVRSSIAATPAWRLWWKPSSADVEVRPVTLIGPIGADGERGADLALGAASDDPMHVRASLEFVTYAVGAVDLGEVVVGLEGDSRGRRAGRIELGSVQVVENVRPRFFARPFRAGLERLHREYERALAAGVASIAVVGAGGSGKSRLCEEFSLERRRRGSGLVSARQAKTLDDPHRILADLFVGLAGTAISLADPADGVVEEIERYDRALATRVEPAIRSIFGTRGRPSEAATEQSVLSSLLLLIVAKGRRAPLIVHLQDLHWCSADVLLLLERLVWQLNVVLSAQGGSPPRDPESGVLFVFEGRVRERQRLGDDGWASEPFEVFLQKLDCPTVPCSPFEPADGLEFIRRLFEDRYSARRMVSGDLLELQRELIERIDRSAGGNPFHSLEQVQLLKERRVLGQNPETGFLYLIQPDPGRSLLPDSVFESIQLRWQYLNARTPSLALLVWAAALLEDRVPTPLFRRLWRELAPDVSLGDVDATDFLWTGDGEEREVAFRHENYFRSVRRFEVSSRDRERVVEIYAGWFDGAKGRDPADSFRWARVLLESPRPDVARARTLLRLALEGARRRGDLRLARRISAASLDLAWNQDSLSPLKTPTFLRRCDEDLALTRELLGTDRSQAARRLDLLRTRLEKRLSSGTAWSKQTLRELQRRELTADVRRSQILFNDRQPAMAAEIAAQVVQRVRSIRVCGAVAENAAWEALEMEALHSQAVGLALSGELGPALRTSEQAVDLARRSPSSLSHHVLSTHGNILMTKDPTESEAALRQCLADVTARPELSDVRHETEINLGMALVLRAHRLGPREERRAGAMLTEARELLIRVFTDSYQLGHYPDASAAALMLGIVSASTGEGDQVSWFAQAVAAAARGQQIETLWRAHINLATALYERTNRVDPVVRDHARAALEIMEDTLSPYPQPDRSARFALIRAPLAQAVRFLIVAGDEVGLAALERYPALRTSFRDAKAGTLRDDRRIHRSHEWLRVGRAHYVLY